MLATENYGATRIGYSGNAESQRQYIFGWELQPEELFPDEGSLRATKLHLKGLVYHGGYHFTCRIIDDSDNIWFHDGISTGRTSINDGKFGTVSQPNLKVCRNKQLCLVIYGHKS